MIVECTQLLPTPEQAERLGRHYRPQHQEFPVELGKKYLVYGLRFWDGGVWVDIVADANYLVIVPLCLFGIVDERVSGLWKVRADEAGYLELLPESFHATYFVDDLIESVPHVRKEFSRVRALLEQEVPESLRAEMGLQRP